jgi:hypothetical protein
MTVDACEELERWLLDTSDAVPMPSTTLTAHVATCKRCQGVLVILLTHLVANHPTAISCDTCLADLPAYLEYEQAHGSLAAAQQYTPVWWHLWTCIDCTVVAEYTSVLVDAHTKEMIPEPPTLPKLRPTRLPPIRIGRSFLHLLCGPQLQLGVSWHDGEDTFFLAEHELPDCRVTIHLLPVNTELWDLEITVRPPIIGRIVIGLGERKFQSSLINGELARVRGIPAVLIAGQDGPDMLIQIEREHGDG